LHIPKLDEGNSRLSACLISLHQASSKRRKNTGHFPLPDKRLGFIHQYVNY